DKRSLPSTMYFYVPMLVFLVLDQLLKYWIRSNMTIGQSIPVISGIFHITYIENPGAAFGILANHRILFLLLTIAITGIMVYLYLSLRNKKSLAALSLGLVISGAAGNFIDRFLRGTVTDMFDFQIWPIFNIADICICIGIAILCYVLIFKGEEL
ncbi:MAG: signal peptidase II, partial [Peptococcaceae bacterium]|nr:signal peptidase II [Peptococcaceae bacterium]